MQKEEEEKKIWEDFVCGLSFLLYAERIDMALSTAPSHTSGARVCIVLVVVPVCVSVCVYQYILHIYRQKTDYTFNIYRPSSAALWLPINQIISNRPPQQQKNKKPKSNKRRNSASR